tara:strand:+ start:1871 stop:2065 length:195 start_codon:yes stop_codon:yes gene_type:complete
MTKVFFIHSISQECSGIILADISNAEPVHAVLDISTAHRVEEVIVSGIGIQADKQAKRHDHRDV